MIRGLTLLLLAGALLHSASAADFTWSGGAVTQTNWDLPANWLPSTTGLYPLANDTAIFGGANAASSWVIDLQSSTNPSVVTQTVGQLFLQGGSYTIGTSSSQVIKFHLESDSFEHTTTIEVGENVVGTQTFEATVVLEQSDSFWGYTIENASSGSLVFNGNILHTGGDRDLFINAAEHAEIIVNGMIIQAAAPINLTYAGSGTLILNGANNFTGKFEIDSGKVVLGSSSTVVSASSFEFWAIDEDYFGTLDTTAFNFTMRANQPAYIYYSETGSGVIGLWNAGTIDITNGAVSFASFWGDPADDSAYVFMTYNHLVGSQFASAQNIPAGYTIDYHYNGHSIALVQVVPEPSSLVLSIGAAGCLFLLRRRHQ